MVNSAFEDKLRARAGAFVRALKHRGIAAAIIEDSFREFSVKVSASINDKRIGTAVIYYKPSSDSFSMKTHELKDKSLAPLLEDGWRESPRSAARSDSRYEIYVDGSHINGATGYGAVILKDGKVVDELCGAVDAEEVNNTRQIAGELIAVREALNWCREHSIDEVSIYYDYLGIEKWATGKWKTNQPLTKDYARFVGDCPIKIHWHKVDSHTGDRWNDRADALAKKGAGSVRAAPGSAGVPPTAPIETDLVSELLKKTDEWIEFLMINGIEAQFDRVYNEQFARVLILRKDQSVGTVDLYNTKKRRFSPYLHNFRDETLKLRIETLWKEFMASRTVS